MSSRMAYRFLQFSSVSSTPPNATPGSNATYIMLIQSLQNNFTGNSYCSLSTPDSPRSISPTPIPSAPTCCLTSRSRSSNRLLAVLSIRSATRSAVLRYCLILCTPSANRSMCGSRDLLSFVRRDCNAPGVVNVNADDGGRCSASCVSGGVGCCGNWRAESIAACSGSRIEGSISESFANGTLFACAVS